MHTHTHTHTHAHTRTHTHTRVICFGKIILVWWLVFQFWDCMSVCVFDMVIELVLYSPSNNN